MSSGNKIREKPNPLFEKWIAEWLADATEKNSEVRHGYRRALSSLQKYPLPLNSGKECLILKYFGPKLCTKLDNKLKEHKLSSDTVEGVNTDKSCQRVKVVSNLQASTKSKNNSKTTLVSNSKSTETIILSAQEKVPEYNPQIVEEKMVFWPNEFNIILLIDNGESRSLQKTSMDKITLELSSLNVNFEMRSLSVGDFAWICRDGIGRELMLPYILERKRLDDLSGSIVDGRFHEQKFRLKQCGLKNKIYLVEQVKNYYGLPISTLQQALANTEVIDGFTVVRTQNNLESVNYIANFSNLLTNIYKDKMLTNHNNDVDSGYNSVSTLTEEKLLSYKSFSMGSAKTKNMTVRDMLIRQLLQLRGLSIQKAFAIVNQYPSPKLLMNAFKMSGNPNLLANLTYGTPVKKVGPIISKTLFQLYSNDNNGT